MSLDFGLLGALIIFSIFMVITLVLHGYSLFFTKYGFLLASIFGWGIWIYGWWISTKGLDELVQEGWFDNMLLTGIILIMISTWGIVEYFKNRKYTKESFKLRKNQKQ